MAETAASDPARFVARDETTINLGEALELDTLRGELLKIPLRICEARGDQLPYGAIRWPLESLGAISGTSRRAKPRA